MGIPYTSQKTGIPGTAATTIVTLSGPPRGILTRLIIKQSAGTLAGFTVDIYDRNDAAGGTTEVNGQFPLNQDGNVIPGSSAISDGTALVDTVLHKLCATLTVAGSASTTANYDLSIPYVNQDVRNYSFTPTGALYALITTTTPASDKAYVASWTMLAPDVF